MNSSYQNKEENLHEYMSANSFLGVAGKYAFGSNSSICARGFPAHSSRPVQDALLTYHAKRVGKAGKIA